MRTKDMIWVVLIVALVAIGGIWIGAKQLSTGGTGVDLTPGTGATGAGCNIAPTVSVSGINAINTGTAVTGLAVNARVNGAYVGNASTYNYNGGESVELIVSKSDFLDTILPAFDVKCGANSKVSSLYATQASTVRVFNDLNDIVTNNAAGGAVNQSSSANVINNKIEFQGTPAQSTGVLVVVIEASNTTQVSDLKLSGSTVANVPKFYSVASAGAIARAFEVPAIVDGGSAIYTLTIEPESDVTIDGTSIRINAYSKQAFVDVDGSFKVGVENANGVVKYEDTVAYAYMID